MIWYRAFSKKISWNLQSKWGYLETITPHHLVSGNAIACIVVGRFRTTILLPVLWIWYELSVFRDRYLMLKLSWWCKLQWQASFQAGIDMILLHLILDNLSSTRTDIITSSFIHIVFRDFTQFGVSPKPTTINIAYLLKLLLTHWGRDKMAAIFRTTFSNRFSWMKMYEFRLIYHWSLFPRVQLTIFQHWFRYWLGTEQATSHYLNQCWPNSTTHISVTRSQCLNTNMILVKVTIGLLLCLHHIALLFQGMSIRYISYVGSTY